MNDQQPPTAHNNSVILSIEHVQRIELSESGATIRDFGTYLKKFVEMVESGLGVRMSNAAFQLLHALRLCTRVLVDPRRAGAEEKFQELQKLGLVSPQVRRSLICGLASVAA